MLPLHQTGRATSIARAGLLLLMPAAVTLLHAQAVEVAISRTVLIVLRQPEGTLGKRLAELPASITVPDEVRAAALSEKKSLLQAQEESFDQRLTSAGAAQVVHYPDLNMVRADVPASATISLQSDPAVISVTPLSEEAPARTGAGVPTAAGVAAGVLGRRPDALQPLSLSPKIQPGVPASPSGAMTPAFMPAMPATSAPPMPIPGTQMQLPGMPGLPVTGGMFQSLLGVTGQMGMQAETAMPRSAGIVMLLSGTAQLAQVILANRKPGCAMTLATAGTQIPEAGGQGVIAVNAPPSCLWQAHSDSDWLQVASEGPMIGPGIVKYTATAAGTGVLRTGVISMVGIASNKVKGKTSITVRQGQ